MVKRRRAKLNLALVSAAGSVVCGLLSSSAQAQFRLKGIDVSDWQGNLSQTTWNSVKAQGRDFAFIRSSRGGTVGFYDETDADNTRYGKNTQSQRYDDLYYQTNMQRAVAAGIYVGNYHFGRAGIITYIDDYGNTITHSGADEANHFLQMAGPWMKPGYLLPTYDLEDGSARSVASLSTWSVDFANTILAAKGYAPMCYVNQSYAISEVNSSVATAMPINWVARWPNQTNPELVDIQNIDPPASPATQNVYGVWNPSFPSTPNPQPWKFWQYGSSNTNVAGISPVDVDVAHGNIEFLKDMLIPALWMTDSSGDWSTISNWNTDLDPTGLGPAARLPGVDDTIILNRSASNPTITLSTGSHTIRKLITQESLNLTGGSLTVGYIPTPLAAARQTLDMWAGPTSAQFSSSVTLGGTATLSVHTLQVDAARTFTINGGNLTANTINLIQDAANPARMLLNGDLNITALSGVTAVIATAGTGSTAGRIDLGGATRTINVINGAANTDLTVSAPIINGSLVKAGAGVMELTGASSFAGSLIINQGSISLAGASGTANTASAYTINSGATLTLDNTLSNNNNRINNATVTLNGGELSLIPNTTTESTGNLVLGQGHSLVRLTGASTSTLAFGSYTRSAGATVNFVGASNSNMATFTGGVSAGSFIDQGTFHTGADYAVYDAAGYVRAMAPGAGASDYAATMTANRHVRLTSSAAAVSSMPVFTLNLAGATVGVTMNASAILTIGNGGVIKSGGGASAISNLVSGATITTGNLTEYVFNTNASTDQLTVSIPITNGIGLTKTGAGVLILSAPNIYGGPTTVNQGTLRLGVAGSIPDTSNLVVSSGATFDMNALSETVGNITVYDGTINSSGTPTLSPNGASPTITYSGTNGGGTISVANLALGTAAGTATFDVANGAASSDLTISSIVQDGTGAHGLTKTGAGTLLLAGNNTFTGNINVNAGALSVSSINATPSAAQPLGVNTGAINLAGGALQYSGGAAATLNRALSATAAGGAIQSTTGALTLGTAGVTSGVSASGPVTFDGNITVNSVISGGTSLVKSGNNTLTLTSANPYTGNTTINEGVIQYNSASGLGQAASTIVFNGGTLRPTAALNETHNVTLQTGGGTLDSNGLTSTFSGVFSGAGSLSKISTGTIVLTNANTYTGATNIRGGTLMVNGSLAAGSSVNVTSTGVLGGTGTVNGPVNLTTGGTVALGAGGVIGGALTVTGPTGGNWNGAGTVNGAVNVNSGTLTLGSGSNLTAPAGVNAIGGTIGGTGTITGNVVLGSTNIYTGATNFTGTTNITGNVTVTSAAEWNGTGNVAGTTTVSSKTLYVNGTLGGAGTLVLASGTNLKGLGTVNKTITLSGNNRLGGHSRLYKSQSLTSNSPPPLTEQGTLTIGSVVNWNAANLFITAGAVSTTGDTISGNLTIQAAPIFEFDHPTFGLIVSDPYHGTLSGTGAATITTTGVVSGQGMIAKPVSLQGGTINFSSAGALGPIGSISSTMIATGGIWAGIGSVSGAVTVVGPGNFAIGAGATLTAPGGVNVTGGTISAGASNSTIAGNVSYASGTPSTWAGDITGAGTTLSINSGGTFVLANPQSYTGQTSINNGILVLTANNQLPGTSGIVNGAVGSLRLSNNVSYSGPSLTLGGAGVNGISVTAPGASPGGLDSLSGSNTWAGSITLAGAGNNGTDPTINQVSAQSGATLVLSGVIQNQVGISASLAKSGPGDVVLTGASANTYPGLTRVYGGRLIIEKDGALGAAGSATLADGNTFQLGGTSQTSTIAFRAPGVSPGINYATVEWINLDGVGFSGGSQLENISGVNTFAGHLGLNGPSGASSIGVTAGSLELKGGIFTRGASGSRTLTKDGSGTLIISGDTALITPNTLNGSLTGSTFNLNQGTTILKGTAGNTANVPGFIAYNVNNSILALGKSGAAGAATITLAGGTLRTDASLTSATPLVSSSFGGGTLDAQTNTSTFSGALSGAGALAKNGAGRITVSGGVSGFSGALTINQGTLAVGANGDVSGTLGVASLSVNPSASLDMADNDLIVNSGTFGAVKNLVLSGFGSTANPGITSSTSDGTQILALFDNALVGGGSWNGQTIAPGAIVGKYTYFGDANFDGQVTGDDYTIIDSNLNTTPPVGLEWLSGDVNLDGLVTGDDYTTIDSNLGLGSGNPLSPNSLNPVPEPSALCAALLVGAGSLIRRRRS